jgi:KDO2-lipid IV(A) lauroyltransferase
VVVAASHTGNWDLAACAIARDVELAVVTKHLSARSLDAFWQATRAAHGVHLIDARGAMARGRDVLARGGVLAMIIDQVPASANHAVRVEFLGRSAFADRAPAALAARSGAPLVIAASRREAAGHVLEVLDVLEPPARAGRAWIDDATRASAHALDRFVRAHPSQWLWLHRRWKTPPGAPSAQSSEAGGRVPPCTTPSSSPAEASRAA